MPIIINSRSCSDAGWWTNHLKKTETNERVEVIGFYGLSAETMEDAFSEMRVMAQGSKRCTNYFSQYNINPRADEHLTEAQWEEAHALHRKNHGLDHLPYFRVRHIKEGRVHEHGIALRVDPETGKAISDSLTAAINERTSRALEIRFDLERGRSILTRDREFERPERRPKKRETFREGEREIDTETVKADARAARHLADNGQSFRVALEASGNYVLARGDRRDFVIVDRAGNDHSLARRLGMKTADMRHFMADLDPASLPSVDQAKAHQAERHRAQEKAEGTRQPLEPETLKETWATAARSFQAPLATPEPAPRPDPANQRRAALCEIHAAWQGSYDRNPAMDAKQLPEAFAAHGIHLARVTAEDAEASKQPVPERRQAKQPGGKKYEPWMMLAGGVAKLSDALRESAERSYERWTETNPEAAAKHGFTDYVSYVQGKWAESQRQAEDRPPAMKPAYREGEIVAVNGFGKAYRLTPRTTGDERVVIEGRLAGIDSAALPSVAAAKDAAREASRAAWIERKDAERAEARRGAPVTQVTGEFRLAWQLSRDDDPARAAAQLSEALEGRGFRLAITTPADAAVSRQQSEEYRARKLAQERGATARGRYAEMQTPEPGRYVPQFAAGEIVAVDGRGSVYRLDERMTGSLWPEIEARLSQVDQDELSSVADAKVLMIEASRAAWIAERQAEREAARPATALEARIIECAEQARLFGAHVQKDEQGAILLGADALAYRMRNADERTGEAAIVYGQEAFGARLDAAGIAVVRVTAADVQALDALRKGEEMARLAAETNGEARKQHHFAELVEGQLAAVTRGGDVHRINADKLRGAEIPAGLPSVTDAQKAFEIDRAQTDALYDLRRADIAAGRDAFADAQGMRQPARAAERAVHAAFETPADAVGKTVRKTGKLAKAAEKIFETAYSLLFGAFMAPPRDTPSQAEQKEKAATNEETLHARGYAATVQAKEAEFDERMHAQKTADQQEDLRSSQRTGRPATREAGLGRGRDDDYEREREI